MMLLVSIVIALLLPIPVCVQLALLVANVSSIDDSVKRIPVGTMVNQSEREREKEEVIHLIILLQVHARKHRTQLLRVHAK